MNTPPANTDTVACFLDGQAYRARVARIRALMDHALIACERLETAVHMHFRLDADVETRLKELIVLEQECCPFLTFTLDKRPGEIVLMISGPERAATLLDEVFGGATTWQ